MMNNNYKINSIFPYPVYVAHRESNLDSTEKKEIEDIIKSGMNEPAFALRPLITQNSYIFDTKLKNLKEFCELHIRNYVREIINPKNEDLDFYITQSWLNIIKPGKQFHSHYHTNSIISGTFYVQTVEDDRIILYDPNFRMKELIQFEAKEDNAWNSDIWKLSITSNDLILFPSWLEHAVEPNEKATTDRLSIAFNVFIKGTVGSSKQLNKLVLI